jgi:hypothetical protein
MTMSAENMITKVKIACQCADLDRLYEALDIPMQPKIRVALFLVFQFESMDFKFDTIYKEDQLQEEYEAAEKEEIIKICGEKGKVAVNKAYPNDSKQDTSTNPS